MRVLMFGWEFPPHISGGLGTACYGLTRGMSHIPDLEVLFVVPKAWGDEDQSALTLIAAENFPVRKKFIEMKNFLREMTYLEVHSRLVPYMSPEDYTETVNTREGGSNVYFNTEEIGRLKFTGKYGPDLFQEIANYALVAGVIADDHSFDLIHAHDWLTYPSGMAAKAVSGKPLVIHVHATDFDRSGGSVNPAVFEIEKRGMEAADMIIAVSNLTRNTVIEKYGINPAKVVTVYNAVEPLELAEWPEFRKPVNEKIVTFLGRITLQKGPEYFVEAAHKVLMKSDNVRFVMAGSGDLFPRIIRRAAKLGIMDRFHFTGFLRGQDVNHMFAISDLYVMPSVSEPFGISPLEAMQSNVPVIISHQSGVSEILKHAIKVDFWDIDAMADAIYGILHYGALSEMFKKHGKTEVDNLKWENSALHVKQVYETVLEKYY
ncbi:MAG: glycosyltransferase family 1 protein [Marinilabiliales bacterium]|nr:MAG: glycosyltransferase family 1 protein [Marinilabiliales bacterium]